MNWFRIDNRRAAALRYLLGFISSLNSYIDADKDGNLLDADGNPIGWKLTDDHEITVDAFAIQDKPFTDVKDAYDAYTKGGAYAPTVDAGSPGHYAVISQISSTKNQKRAYICAMDGTTVYVTGGTFGPASTRSGYTAGIKTDGTGKVIITGGTFGFDPSTWVAVGYVATKDGSTWTVTAQ